MERHGIPRSQAFTSACDVRMKISDLFPSRWLSPADLQGRSVRVTIKSVELVSLRDPRTKQENAKAVVYFEGKQKALILNKTNAFKIAELLGDDTDSWIGGQITLFPDEIMVAGVKKKCIRVRE